MVLLRPLSPGSGSVVEKKEKLANVICPGYGVLGYCGGRVSRVHVNRETRQAEELDPVEAPAMSPPDPYTIPVNPSAVLAVEWHGKPPRKEHAAARSSTPPITAYNRETLGGRLCRPRRMSLIIRMTRIF